MKITDTRSAIFEQIQGRPKGRLCIYIVPISGHPALERCVDIGVPYTTQNHSLRKWILLLPILDHEALADTADGELLAFFPAKLAHEFFGDVDVVALPTVFDNFSCVFLHAIILP